MFVMNNDTITHFTFLIINVLFSLFCLLYFRVKSKKMKLLETRILNLEKLNENILNDYNKKFNELKSLVLKHHNEYKDTFTKEEKRVNEKFDFLNMDIKKIKKTINY